MGSWFNRLFGRDKKATNPSFTHEEDYQGYLLQIQPRAEGHQYRVAAYISKISNPEQRHHMIRADVCPSIEIATEQSLLKARQAVDQLGEQLFERTPSS